MSASFLDIEGRFHIYIHFLVSFLALIDPQSATPPHDRLDYIVQRMLFFFSISLSLGITPFFRHDKHQEDEE